MAQNDNYKRLTGGLDRDSSPEDIHPSDYIDAQNTRNTGSEGQQLGYNANIGSTTILAGSLLPGLNNICGGGRFDDTGQILAFRYNSAGNCQILLYDFATDSYSVIYTDVTDSGGATLLPLNPQNQVTAILINKLYPIWWANGLEVGYTNLQTLASGGYGTVLWEDLSLLKPQCPYPILPVPDQTTPDVITSGFGSDLGQPANFLYSKLIQIIVQGVNADFNYTEWSTRSKRFTPYQENTPTLGAAVSQNNYIVVPVFIWSTRIVTLNVAAQFDDSDQFYLIKSIDTAYIYALPNTAVDVSTEILEAYDPSTNTYYFVFYNNTVTIPVDQNATSLLYSPIWPSNAGVQLNGNIPGLGDWQMLYPRPVVSVNVAGIGYNPNIDIPANTYTNPLKKGPQFNGASGSGAGDHRRKMFITLTGVPHTGDVVVIILADIRNAQNTQNYSYPVPPAQDGNLLAVVTSISETLSGSYEAVSGGYQIFFTGQPYFGLQTFSVELFFAGATVANSIPTILDNTSYQLAIEFFDYKNRPFPISTDNTYILSTQSYAQQNGNATEINVTINDVTVPDGAVYAQLLITKPPVLKVLDTIAALINYKGGWDARTNTPSLAINSGDIGDAWQITTPFSIAAQTSTTPYTNLGTGEDYKTGDYVVDVGGTSGGSQIGQYYAVLPKTFGNLATAEGGILVFSLNSLALLNSEYNQQSVTTNLVYDFAQGDRCTLHYWIDSGGTINYFNEPCIDLAVLGYDAGTYLVKVENSAALTFASGHILYNGNQIDARNIFMRLYSPAPQSATDSTAINTTVWFEIGENIPITNGEFAQNIFTITDGGAYYKTRQFPDAIKPYNDPPIQVLATDLNYSDFYPSAFYSFGRPRTFYDVLEKSEQQALIITGQPYVLGSRVNGLNRFYPQNIYGNNNGQTSSSKGSIQIMEQVGQELWVLQALGVFRIPVNEAYTVLNDELTGQSISSILLNNGRYDPENVGIGNTKAFCRRYSTMYFIDPNKSLPYKITNRVEPISGKMSQFFKSVLQLAYSQGKQIRFYYDDYYEEAVLTIQAEGGQIFFFPFALPAWNPFNDFVIVGTDVSATPNGAHSTASYNSSTGIVTYTPAANYVGGDTPTFTFTPPGGSPTTLNNCLQWIAGNTTVNPFSFNDLFNQPLSTTVFSNSITVSGPNIGVPVSVTGGQYSINGGAFTSSPGTTFAGDTIQVNNLTSASNSTTTTTTLTIGTTSGSFDAETVSSSPAFNVTVNNFNSNGAAIAGGSVVGSTSFGPVYPGGSAAFNVSAGTYTVVVVTGAGGARTCTVNGVSHSSSGKNTFNFPSVSTPITIVLS